VHMCVCVCVTRVCHIRVIGPLITPHPPAPGKGGPAPPALEMRGRLAAPIADIWGSSLPLMYMFCFSFCSKRQEASHAMLLCVCKGVKCLPASMPAGQPPGDRYQQQHDR
jgi:hypothetical protein